MIEAIDDVDDPRVADYVALKEGERAGSFIAEGLLVVEALLSRGRYPVRSILVAEGRLDRLPPVPATVPVYVASQVVLDRIVGFPIHRGVLAAGDRTGAAALDTLLDGLEAPRGTLVVGVGLSNHDNVGSLFRNAAGLGADAVILDDRSADPLYRKAIRVSMGHALTLPSCARAPLPRILAALGRRGWKTWATTPGEGARDLGELLRGGGEVADRKVAVLVGAEGEGLDPAVIAGADVRVRIPMREGVDSLNVATAAAIVLFALGSSRP